MTEIKQEPLPEGYTVDLNGDPEENKILAEFLSEFYRETIIKTIDIGVNLAKWVQTSLLAVNGAAAVATWGLDIDPVAKVASCGLFICGVLAALLSGHLSVKSIPKQTLPVAEAMFYWLTVKQDGFRQAEMEGHEQVIAEAVRRRSLPSVAAGWISIALFITGAVAAGQSVINDLPQRSHGKQVELGAPTKLQAPPLPERSKANKPPVD